MHSPLHAADHPQGMADAVSAVHLPPVAVWRVTWTALQPQRLPALVTTALHGAFDDAVRALGDPQLHTTLCNPPPLPDGARGATTRGPGAVVFAPEHYDPDQPYLALREGEAVSVRVCLVGEAALARQAEMDAALRGVAARGLGIDPRRPDGPRPRLRYERPHRLVPPGVSAGEQVGMVMETPLHVVVGEKVQRRVEAEWVWRAMVRRVDLLARAYGGAAEGVVLPRDAPFAVTAAQTRRVWVDRWSSTQGKRMTWPGLLGSATLAGEGLLALGPLLGFIQQVGLGKHTGFGLGRVWFVTE